MKIPSNNIWTQTNDGDIFGTLNDTKNMTLDQDGKIKLSKKSFNVFNSDSESNLGNVRSMVFYNNNYIAVTDDEAFEFNLAGGTPDEISSAPNLYPETDAMVLFDRMYVTSDNDFAYWNGSSWTKGLGSLTADVPHPMAVFDSLSTFKLAIANGNTVKLYDSSHNLSPTELALPAQFQISSLVYRNGYLYVGTQNTNGGEARVFIWNGSGTNAQYEVPTGATWVFSMTPYGSTVACIADTGELFSINGSSKQHLAGLPVFFNKTTTWERISATSVSGKVYNRAMVTVGDTIYMNIDGSVDIGEQGNMKSGVWTFNPASGINHYATSSSVASVEDNALVLADSTITTALAHGLQDGDTVVFETAQLTGIDSDVVYYASVVSTTEIKLALSETSLQAGNFVKITGTPTVTDRLVYAPNTDLGAAYEAKSGAIMRTVQNDSIFRNWNNPVIWGSKADKQDLSNLYAINALTEANNVGTFTLQRVNSDNTSQNWKNVITNLDSIFSHESLIIKARTSKAQAFRSGELAGTWTSTNEINSDTARSDQDDWMSVEEEQEVTVVDGYGRGHTAHITNVSRTTSVTTITIDKNIGTVGGVVRLYAENYKKVTSFTNDNYEDGQLDAGGMEEQGKWLQVKCEVSGTDIAISHLDIENSINSKKG